MSAAFKVYNCTPWNLPGPTAVMCDPLQAERYLKLSSSAKVKANCPYCLPDCEATNYQYKVSSAPIRRCNHQNMGATTLCSFDISADKGGGLTPQMWAEYAVQVSEDRKRMDILLNKIENKT